MVPVRAPKLGGVDSGGNGVPRRADRHKFRPARLLDSAIHVQRVLRLVDAASRPFDHQQHTGRARLGGLRHGDRAGLRVGASSRGTHHRALQHHEVVPARGDLSVDRRTWRNVLQMPDEDRLGSGASPSAIRLKHADHGGGDIVEIEQAVPHKQDVHRWGRHQREREEDDHVRYTRGPAAPSREDREGSCTLRKPQEPLAPGRDCANVGLHSGWAAHRGRRKAEIPQEGRPQIPDPDHAGVGTSVWPIESADLQVVARKRVPPNVPRYVDDPKGA